MCIRVGLYGIEVILHIPRAGGNAEVRYFIRLVSQFICDGVLANDPIGMMVAYRGK